MKKFRVSPGFDPVHLSTPLRSVLAMLEKRAVDGIVQIGETFHPDIIDRLVSEGALKTVDPDPPQLQTAPASEPVRRADGRLLVNGHGQIKFVSGFVSIN